LFTQTSAVHDTLANKKNNLLEPKMFQLFLPNFGALTSQLQSVFLYQV